MNISRKAARYPLPKDGKVSEVNIELHFIQENPPQQWKDVDADGNEAQLFYPGNWSILEWQGGYNLPVPVFMDTSREGVTYPFF
ncbi:hypothetical protein Y032_0675g1422 [Ancylostoma ceylanicum]|uniref:Uncharacterized protein n=1 Tax=Ancylostoma ceylanicum TaxID=53326 RepID=A0A016WHK4_9BILA|nr:hypothetical protein Y032_0675g1422 [Ancylostoma ceylanicum]